MRVIWVGVMVYTSNRLYNLYEVLPEFQEVFF